MRAQTVIDKYYASHPAYGDASRLTTEHGSRYVKVWKTSVNNDGTFSDSRSIYCFVDKKNGNILKAASWRAPEREHPRGNIFDGDPLQAVDHYGAVYRRGR